jgi:hypothetical protein
LASATRAFGDPWERRIRPERQAAYFAAVEREAERAWSEHGLLVLPGLELTDNAPDPDSAAHVLAVGLHAPVSLARGIESGIASARAAGAVIVAAHPAGPEGGPGSTRRLWRERDAFHHLIDCWELINGHTVFPWVADARLPVVANGDFHRPEHLATWKTLLPTEQDEEAILDFLCSRARLHLTVFDPVPKSVAA